MFKNKKFIKILISDSSISFSIDWLKKLSFKALVTIMLNRFI